MPANFQQNMILYFECLKLAINTIWSSIYVFETWDQKNLSKRSILALKVDKITMFATKL